MYFYIYKTDLRMHTKRPPNPPIQKKKTTNTSASCFFFPVFVFGVVPGRGRVLRRFGMEGGTRASVCVCVCVCVWWACRVALCLVYEALSY